MNEELEKFHENATNKVSKDLKLIVDLNTDADKPESKQLIIDNIKYKKKVNPDNASKNREIDVKQRLKSIKDSKKTGDLF